MSTYAIYGAGGYGRENVESLILSLGMRYTAGPTPNIIFIDDDSSYHGHMVHGRYEIVSISEAKQRNDLRINIALANPGLRRQKTTELSHIPMFEIVDSSVRIGPNVQVKDGAIFSAFSIVTSDAQIGKAFHCNIYSYVAHDCIIGDFVTLAPRVSINGRVKVEDDVYIGTGAIILPGKANRFLTIGKGATIGAGALVTKDVEPGATMVGSPARPL